MKSAFEDLENRKFVWNNLQILFMDTDVKSELNGIADKLAASPYSLSEIESILAKEVFPACWFNLLLFVGGEWAGFDIEWLSNRILKRQKRRWLKMPPLFGRSLIRPYWYALEELISAKRGEKSKNYLIEEVRKN